MDYIDRDTAIRTAIEICVKVVGHGISQIDAVNIADAFEDIPTADVVPKSEVERLEAELDDFTVASLAECRVCGEKTTKVIADLQEKLSNAKAEVAEDILKDKILIDHLERACGAGGKLALARIKELKERYEVK